MKNTTREITKEREGVDFFDEIKESIVSEKKEKLGQIILFTLFILGFILIAIVAYKQWSDNQSLNSRLEEQTQFISTIEEIQKPDLYNVDDQGKLEERIEKAIKKIENIFYHGNSVYAAYSGFFLTNIAIQKGNISIALHYLEKIAQDTRFDQSIRDYAVIQIINTKIKHQNIKGRNILHILHSYFTSNNNKNRTFTLENTIANTKEHLQTLLHNSPQYANTLFRTQFMLLNAIALLSENEFEKTKIILKQIINNNTVQNETKPNNIMHGSENKNHEDTNNRLNNSRTRTNTNSHNLNNLKTDVENFINEAGNNAWQELGKVMMEYVDYLFAKHQVNQ